MTNGGKEEERESKGLVRCFGGGIYWAMENEYLDLCLIS